jgi:hypothetical protein
VIRARATRLGALAVGLVAAATVAAGLPATSDAAAPAVAANGQADWTLMIYDVADTANIADEMVRNLKRFAALPPMSNVNVVALVDLPERTDPGAPSATIPGIGQFTTAKLLVLADGGYQEVRDLGEVSMGRPDVLASFIEEAADRFPADKYGLVLSDHGGAYTGGYIDTGPPSSSGLSVQEMRLGMLQGMQAAGIGRFDLLDHDSCLMSSYEAVSALAPLAQTMVGSEEVTWGDNTLTAEAIAGLGENVTAAQWGQTNIEQYAADLDHAPQGIGGFSALSVIDGDQVSRLDSAIDSFADVAAAHMDEIAPQVGLARSKALEFAVGPLGSDQSINAIDLGDFLKHLVNLPPEVEVARDAVFTALTNAVVGQVTRPATQQATGLNVFFPGSPDQAGSYLDGHLGPAGWSRFVAAYVDASTQGAADRTASFVSNDADVLEQGPTGIRIAGQLGEGDAANVTEAETRIFTRIDGKDALASILPAYLNSGGEGMVQGVWDYAVTSLSDNGRSVPASAVYQAQQGGLVGTFWARYRDPAGGRRDVAFRVLLDSQGRIKNVTVSDAGNDGTAGVKLEPGGELTPYVIVPSSNSFDFVPSSQTIAVSKTLRVDYPQLDAGTRFDMVLVVFDLDGSGDGALVSARVPEGRTR